MIYFFINVHDHTCRSQKRVLGPQDQVTGGYELPDTGAVSPNLSALEDRRALLTTEPPLQYQADTFLTRRKHKQMAPVVLYWDYNRTFLEKTWLCMWNY